jgi:hypothetical protein
VKVFLMPGRNFASSRSGTRLMILSVADFFSR